MLFLSVFLKLLFDTCRLERKYWDEDGIGLVELAPVDDNRAVINEQNIEVLKLSNYYLRKIHICNMYKCFVIQPIPDGIAGDDEEEMLRVLENFEDPDANEFEQEDFEDDSEQDNARRVIDFDD